MQKKIEKPKLKHNKKRNTAFLFEALVKELTKAVLYSDKEKQSKVSSLIKEHFKKNTILEKELSLYKQLSDTKEFPQDYAEKLINRIREEHQKLNEKDIFDEQSKLIAKINKTVGVQVYDNFVPNYKTLASVSQIFNTSVPQTKKILLEQELLNNITSKKLEEKKELKPIDSLTFKVAVDKFNKIYGEKILPEQKELLYKFINYADDDVDLKLYLSEQLEKINNEISAILEQEVIKSNEDLFSKVRLLQEQVSEVKFDKVTSEVVEKVINIYEFLNEVKN